MREFEDKLYKEKIYKIAGLDEVGRGCWAGPLVVAICVLKKERKSTSRLLLFLKHITSDI